MAERSDGRAAGHGELRDLTGSRVGRFEVRERLGAGGMGEVYRADDPKLGRPVALKRVASKVRADPRFRKRLLAEARRASTLGSTHIAGMYDVLEEGGEVFLVMEYVEGEPLRNRIGRPMPVPEVVSLARQCAEALATAHEKGVLHRDIKPDNLMVTPTGAVKVLDFGVARRLPSRDELESADATLTATEGGLTGTPSYMAPEELLQRDSDGRADLFSLGVVLYEALTGEHPFRDDTFVRTADRILHTEPPPPSRANPEVPPALDAVVARLLAKDPEARYASAQLLRDDLEELEAGRLEGPPARAGAGRLSAFLRSPSSRWLAAAAMLVVLAGVLAAVGGLGRWLAGPPDPDSVPTLAVLPFRNATGDPANDHLGLGFADSLTTGLAAVPAVNVVYTGEARGAARDVQDLRRLAREEGADYLADGTIQLAAEQLLVNVRLLTRDGSVVWASRYEDSFARIFDLQRRLGEGVSAGLRLTLTAADRERLARPPTVDLAAYQDYLHAISLLERLDRVGNVSRAVDLLRRAVEADPSFALAFAKLGDAYWWSYEETGDLEWSERALEATRRASALDPDNPLVRVSLARVYGGTGQLAEAEEEVRRAVRLQPSNDEAVLLLGRVLEERNRPAEALEAYRRAVSLRPDYWRNLTRLGAFYNKQARFEEAIAAFRRVVELQPDSGWAHQNLGAAYYGAGDLDSAMASYQRALDLTPEDWALVSNIAVLYRDEGELEVAAQLFERAVELKPLDPMIHGNLGHVYERLGETDRAREAYERAADLAEESLSVNLADASMLSRLAVFEAKLGRLEEAVRHAERAVELAPTWYGVRYRVGIVFLLAGREDDALAGLEAAISHGFPADRAARDHEWEPLREHPTFRALVESGT